MDETLSIGFTIRKHISAIVGREMYAQSGGGAQVVERYARPESVHCTNSQMRVISVGVGSSGRSVVSTDSERQAGRVETSSNWPCDSHFSHH